MKFVATGAGAVPRAGAREVQGETLGREWIRYPPLDDAHASVGLGANSYATLL